MSDFGYNDDVIEQPYQSPVEILPSAIDQVPDEGTFALRICTTKDRLNEMFRVLRVGAIQLEYKETGDYNIDLIKALEAVVLDCEASMDCEEIEACLPSTATIVALKDEITNLNMTINTLNAGTQASYLPDEPNVMDERFPSSQRNQPIISESLDDGMGGCDHDKLWSAISLFIDEMNKLALDLLETFTASADKLQRAAAASGAIPFLGDQTEAVLSQVAETAQDVENAYVAFDSESTQNDLKCEIFCFVKDECRWPTYQELLDIYASAGGTDLEDFWTLNFSVLLGRIFVSAIAQLLAWYGIQSVILFVLMNGGSILGQKKNVLPLWMLEGSKSPTDEWLVLCEDCGELPEYPQLVNTRCEDAFTAGTLTQIAPDTWRVVSEIKAPGPANYLCFRDVSNRVMDIASITQIGLVVPTTMNKRNATCVVSNTTLANLVSSTEVHGVYMATGQINAGSFEYEVVFNPIP